MLSMFYAGGLPFFDLIYTKILMYHFTIVFRSLKISFMNKSDILISPEDQNVIDKHREIVKKIIINLSHSISQSETLQVEPQFNDENGIYSLVKTGWHKGEFFNDTILTIRLKGKGVAIIVNKTNKKIDKNLIKLGILKDYILLPPKSNKLSPLPLDFASFVILDPLQTIFEPIFTNRSKRLRLFGFFCLFLIGFGLVLALSPKINLYLYSDNFSIVSGFIIFSGILGLIAWVLLENFPDSLTEIIKSSFRNAQSEVVKNPQNIKSNWNLGSTVLSAYFNRNLKQIDLIFKLSVFVMLIGLGLVVLGIVLAYQKPESITVALVGGVAGVITQFIGATFIFMYKSTIAQSTKYTETLERIHSVGMAMQILDEVRKQESLTNTEELVSAKIDIAKLLLEVKDKNNGKKDEV